MSADEFFNKLGMLKTLDNDDTVIYRFKDDYKDNIITFDKRLKRFNYHCAIFIFENQATWEEMNRNHKFRDDFDKHCSKYGYWGNFPNDIGIELLQAINKKVEELRLDKELNEAIEWLKNNIKYYQEQLKIISVLDDSDYYDEEIELYKNRIKIFDNILNYIENSIPKKKVEGKIKELDKDIEDYLQTDKSGRFTRTNCIFTYKKEALQELLEEK